MKLDIDCVRDIMIWVEETTTPTHFAVYVNVDLLDGQGDFLYPNPECMPRPNEQQQKLLKKYSNEVLVYHLNYCVEAELLALANSSDGISITIRDLTPKGHDFIGNIRHGPVFQKTKDVLETLGVKTLDAAVQVSALVVSELIKSTIFKKS